MITISGLDNTSLTVRSVTAATTLTQNDFVLLVSPTGGNVTVTLPLVANVQPGRQYVVKRDATATNTVTLAAAGSDTINGSGTAAIGAAGTAGADWVVSDGTNWHIIDKY